jgi:hypothetical protein
MDTLTIKIPKWVSNIIIVTCALLGMNIVVEPKQ